MSHLYCLSFPLSVFVLLRAEVLYAILYLLKIIKQKLMAFISLLYIT